MFCTVEMMSILLINKVVFGLSLVCREVPFTSVERGVGNAKHMYTAESSKINLSPCQRKQNGASIAEDYIVLTVVYDV
uniref:Putative secreted protein n=1 Tax=Panstrongylus lignarius TaxID=156445 RepID=A0A224XT67_9HEMI